MCVKGFMKIFYKIVRIVLISYLLQLLLNDKRNALSAIDFDQMTNQQRMDLLIKESYTEVSAHASSYFNEKCNLAIQNCLFQTQWERVFGRDKIKEKTKKRSFRSISSINTNITYYYCQAFLVAKFCIDEYLKKSIDNMNCLNGTDGNSPKEFKRFIYKNDCKPFYTYFFEHLNKATNTKIFKKYFCYLYILIFLMHVFYFQNIY
jgi:hypothetical protein